MGPQAGPQDDRISKQSLRQGEPNSMNEGWRQLLPKQLHPEVARRPAKSSRHEAVRDIVDISSDAFHRPST